MNRYFLGNYYISDGTKPIDIKVKKPIEWVALDNTEDGKTLLYSRDVLDWDMYGDGEDVITWENSFMSYWLNNLYNEYFTDDEKAAIIPNSLGPLFLLTEEEILRYIPTEEDRRAVQYFVQNKDGEIDIYMEHNTYWLYKENCIQEEIPYVDEFGKITYGSGGMDEIGIRIAMWVDTKKARIISAGKGFNRWHHFWELTDF